MVMRAEEHELAVEMAHKRQALREQRRRRRHRMRENPDEYQDSEPEEPSQQPEEEKVDMEDEDAGERADGQSPDADGIGEPKIDPITGLPPAEKEPEPEDPLVTAYKAKIKLADGDDIDTDDDY